MNCDSKFYCSGTWRKIATFLCVILTPSFFSPGPVAAQDASEAGRQALEKKRFPWFDSNSQSISELKQKDPGRAESINRGDLPVYVAPANRPVNPNTGTGLFPILSTGVWILIAILFLVIVGVLVWFFLKMEARTGLESSGSSQDEEADIRERITQLPFVIHKAATGDFREQAAQVAREGDFGRAMMLLFSHVLLQLDRKGLIRLRKGKTNRQYLHELRSHQALTSYYRKVMLPFEDSFFGDHTIDRVVFEECWRNLDAFQEQVNQCVQAAGP